MTRLSNKTFRISYYGQIRSIVHKSEELLSPESLSEPTMMDILKILDKEYGPHFQELVFHNSDVNRALNVFVNGKCLTQKKDFEERLVSGSEIEIVFISQAARG